MTARTPRISVASPTGQQWRIGHGSQDVVVCEVGATLRAYSAGDHPVIDGFGADEWSHSGRGQVLAPWPNRLADGRYEFNGVRAQAALDEPERHNAIHGLVRWLPWTLQTRHQNQLSLRLQLHPSPGYPFSLLLEIDYHVGRDGLTVTTRASSLDDGIIPFGLGFHPYLTAGPETVDGAILRVAARAHARRRRPGAAHRRAHPRRGHRPRLHGGAVRRAGGARHRLHDARTRRRRPRLGQPRRARRCHRRGPLGGRGLLLPDGVHGRHARRDPAAPSRRRHRAHDVPAQRAAHRQGRDRPPAGPGVVGALGHRRRGERRKRRGRGRLARQGRRRHRLVERDRRGHRARLRRRRRLGPRQLRPFRRPRARRSPRRCPTRTTCRATSRRRARPTGSWPPPSSGGGASTCS